MGDMVLDMDMVLVMLVTEDLDTMDTTLESDLLMLKLSQKASHGTDMVLDMDMVLVMLVTEDLDIMDTTLESDLLMLSQKASHGTDTVDTDTAAMVLVMVDTMVGENKLSKSYYNNESKFQKKTFFKVM